jgi:predicted amidohydrolase YtcJ
VVRPCVEAFVKANSATMKSLSTYFVLLALAPSLLSAQAPADLVLTNGRIYTVDNARPVVSALAARDGRIVFIGSDAEAKALAGAGSRLIDLHGATVVPGIVDAHAHLLGLGIMLSEANVAGAASYQEVIDRVKAWAKDVKPGQWIVGRGWDQNRWPTKEFPTHEALSRAFPQNPVVLERIDGHAVLANAKAMELAGVTAGTREPSGGRIVRLASGSPSGVFVDNAESLIERAIPPLSSADTRKAILAAIAECNRWGLTGIHDPGEDAATIAIYEDLARAGNYNLRNYVMLSDPGVPTSSAALDNPYLHRGPQSALYDGHLWVRAIKLYADGALGSRGAALLAPYSDDTTNSGLLVSQPAHLEAWAEAGLRRGFQINVHAIGDRGNRNVLDAFETALRAVPKADHRFRIEHAQVLSPTDIPRFAKLGVIPSMQATHQTSDMPWAESRLGPERIRGAYAWRSLLNHPKWNRLSCRRGEPAPHFPCCCDKTEPSEHARGRLVPGSEDESRRSSSVDDDLACLRGISRIDSGLDHTWQIC